MGLRRDLLAALRADEFAACATALCDRYDLPDEVRRRVAETGAETALPVDPSPDDRALVWRCWALDAAPLGVTVAGPAYRDTPLVYANRRFRALTGYPLDELVGSNPRLLQGPRTDEAAVAALREAVAAWTPATVTLWNHRRDGTAFENRVTVAPVVGPDGTVTNWLGVQERVDGRRAEQV